MKRLALLLAVVLAASARPAIAAPDKIDAAPAGLTPSPATVSQVLKAYDAALGHRIAENTSTEQWSFNRSGLVGTESLVRSGSDYYSKIAAGPLVEEFGQLAGHSWHRDFNGVVSPVSSPQLTSFEMLIFMDALNDASDPKYDVKVAGEVADPQPDTVLSLKRPQDKHLEYLYYNKRTSLIDKVSFVSGGDRYTVSYGDYRTTKGLAQPWHVHVTQGTAVLDDDYKRTSLAAGIPVNTMRFVTPASTLNFASFENTVKLPAQVIWDRYEIDVGGGYQHDADAPTLVVRVNVNGRGLDFAVSAGESNSLIDSDVAQSLGLPTFGQTTRADGKPVAYDTVIPSAQIGPLALRNFAVRALPFNYNPSDATKVVGVLGFDVLSSGVFKMDFDNGTLELHPAREFDQTNMVNDPSSMLPVVFDSGYPFVQGMLDSHYTQNVLFDNDYEMSFLFGGFVDRYPDAVSDAVTGKQHGVTTIPFADSNGYGKSVSVFMGKIPDLQVGPAHFVNYQIVAVDGPVYYSGREVDAVMGGDVLRYYDVYLDYPHNRIFLRPNKSFFKDFKVQ